MKRNNKRRNFDTYLTCLESFIIENQIKLEWMLKKITPFFLFNVAAVIVVINKETLI